MRHDAFMAFSMIAYIPEALELLLQLSAFGSKIGKQIPDERPTDDVSQTLGMVQITWHDTSGSSEGPRHLQSVSWQQPLHLWVP